MSPWAMPDTLNLTFPIIQHALYHSETKLEDYPSVIRNKHAAELNGTFSLPNWNHSHCLPVKASFVFLMCGCMKQLHFVSVLPAAGNCRLALCVEKAVRRQDTHHVSAVNRTAVSHQQDRPPKAYLSPYVYTTFSTFFAIYIAVRETVPVGLPVAVRRNMILYAWGNVVPKESSLLRQGKALKTRNM